MSKPPPHTSFFTALLPTVLIWRSHRDSSASYLQITWLNKTRTWQIGTAKVAAATPPTRIQPVRPSATAPKNVPRPAVAAAVVLHSPTGDLDIAFDVLIGVCRLEYLSADKKQWLKKQLAKYPLIQAQLRQQDTLHPYQCELLRVWVNNLLEGGEQ
ncbi:hypothetical protein [Conchiformibius steedae]|uniref:hypothetical protein n=1 Tax=Conchiformibius steedae TaxID=153493 RepID=UPI0026EC429F|nr:hypothetical protein [Conchiformibius steedae]